MGAVIATPDRIPALKAIWRDAFPEDLPEEIDSFFEAIYAPGRCLVWLEKGQPVSMTFMLPATLETYDNGVPVSLRLQYIYAAATLSSFRGRGIFGRLLTEAHVLARGNQTDASFLRPAQPGLVSYYERFGYRSFFSVQTESIFLPQGIKTKRHTAPSPIDSQDRSQMASSRNALLSEHPAWVRWPDFLVEYAVTSSRKNGGELLAVEGGWALCEPAGDTVWIREWLCRPEAESALLDEVSTRFQAAEAIRRRPVPCGNSLSDDAVTPFGMLCPLSAKAADIAVAAGEYPYMGLAFD